MKTYLSNLLRSYYCNNDYSWSIINNLIDNEKTLDIKKRFRLSRNTDLSFLWEILSIININLLYLNEDPYYKEILNYNFHEWENEYSLYEYSLLSFFIWEDIYLTINNWTLEFVEKNKLFKNITNTLWNIKYFSIWEIIKSILPKDLLKKIRDIKKNLPKDLKSELNNLNNIAITLDKQNIISYKSNLISKFLFKYTDEIEKILIRKWNIDEKFIKEYAEKLNDSLYKLSWMPQLYTK